MKISDATPTSMPISETNSVQDEQRSQKSASLGELQKQQITQSIQNLQKVQINAEEKKVSTDDVRLATDKANKLASVFNRNLKFEYKEEAGITQVTVWDANKEEVIRKIPSDEMVRFVERIQDLLGATFDAFV